MVTLYKHDLSLIFKIVQGDNELSRVFKERVFSENPNIANEAGQPVRVYLSKSDKERLLDLISLKLMDSGVGEDGEVNAFGSILEDLIDRICRDTVFD